MCRHDNVMRYLAYDVQLLDCHLGEPSTNVSFVNKHTGDGPEIRRPSDKLKFTLLKPALAMNWVCRTSDPPPVR